MTEIIKVSKWNLKEECQTQNYLQLCKSININNRGVGYHRKDIDAINRREKSHIHTVSSVT
jgi:hypothetical protein